MNFLIPVIALGGALVIYTLIRILIPVWGREIINARFGKYLATNATEDIQDQVLRERREKERRNYGNVRFISSEFADVIASSGVKLTPAEFLRLWAAATFVPVILAVVISGSAISATAAGIIGLAVPPLLLRKAINKRKEIFTLQLGEALMIIGNSLKGGFSLQQAMDSVAREMDAPLADEFAKTMREIRFGLPLDEALRHMTERTKNKDLDLFVSAVLTSAQVGSNLTDILDVLSTTIKDRIRIKQEVKVLTASGRISGIIIGLLPVFLILVLMLINPNYFGSFFEQTIGKIMAAIGICMEITGFIIISKITDIQY